MTLSYAEDLTHANVERVRRSTSEAVNRQIDQKTDSKIARYQHATHGEIAKRIQELDREWDIERVLEVNASTLALTGLTLGVTMNKKWLALPGIVLPFLLMHGLQGWCPPVPILRRLGVRTRDEINRERYALISILDGR